MLLTEFINRHDDWEKILSEPPYCIRIKRENGYLMFSYSQIESDFSLELVRECRGVILDEKTFRPVCVPFYKFGNYGESYVPEIDWKSARAQEKIDGSLIKVWFDKGEWRVSTNGNIDAKNSELSKTDLFDGACTFVTFADLFEAAKRSSGLNFDKLDKNCTYMFELVSPYNKVVILYNEIKLYHIGTRNNVTLEECEADIGLQKPKEFDLSSLEDCIQSAKMLPPDKEGYVIVDGSYNRIKIKNPVYVALHHFKNNNEPSLDALIDVVRKNECEEFVTYFPEFKSLIYSCKNNIEKIINGLETELQALKRKTFETKKDFALEVKDKPFSSFYFVWYRDNGVQPKAWFWNMPTEKFRKILLNMQPQSK